MPREKVDISVESLAILIPTRNRPTELSILLKSIMESSFKPTQVVIVASGQDVEVITDEFSGSLPITYHHTETTGQIAQKRLGMELVLKEIDWCLFLDDDLILEESTLALALNAAKSYPKKDIIGIGLSMPPSSRALSLTASKQKILKLFMLSSSFPGKVHSSGHAASYLQEQRVIETQWLNGASIWRMEHARNYGKDLPSTPYAACEDLIFSYPLSKKGTLVYIPDAKVNFQDSEMSQFDSFEVLRAASLWRYFFVNSHGELSFTRFFLSQVVRAIYAIKQSKKSKVKLSIELIKLNLKIMKSYLTKIPPHDLLNELKN